MTYFYTEHDYLSHHGIKGQRWGIRRYRNYDGSYTQAGLKRYDITKKNLDTRKEQYKTAKGKYKSGEITKLDLNKAKGNLKEAKREERKYYKNLRVNKMADQGKQMYAEGKTITGNNLVSSMIGEGTATVAALMYMYGDQNAKDLAVKVGAAGLAISGGMALVNHYKNQRIRAYYAHKHLPMPKDISEKKDSSGRVKTAKVSSGASKTARAEAKRDRALERFNRDIDKLNSQWSRAHGLSDDDVIPDSLLDDYDSFMIDQMNKYGV